MTTKHPNNPHDHIVINKSTMALLGKSCGMLKVIDHAPYTTKTPRATMLCQCECGVVKPVLASHLRRGTIRSCGCIRGKSDGHMKQLQRQKLNDYQAKLKEFELAVEQGIPFEHNGKWYDIKPLQTNPFKPNPSQVTND